MKRNVGPEEKDFTLLRGWTEGFCTPMSLPVSFSYGEKKLQGIPWKAQVDWKRIDANLTHTTITAMDPETKLQIKAICEQYNDFPVLEWTVFLTNMGEENTPVIRDLLGLDAAFPMAAPILQHGNGDCNMEKSFEFFDRALTEEVFEMHPARGLPCDSSFPYMRILSKEEGVGMILSIGWPGQWKAQLSYDGQKAILRAGQAETEFYLKPGETVRTPRMTLVAFHGEKNRAVNLWRRWYFAHVMPKNDGAMTKPKVFINADRPKGEEEHTTYTQEKITRAMEIYDARGVEYDCFWLDAGWYADCGTVWKKVGTWEARQPNYPEGILGVSKACRAHDAEMLLWFDPERAYDGTKIAREHPEWLLDPAKEIEKEPYASWFDNIHLVNIGIPEAWEHITDLICNFVEENQINWYRQDFNIWPLYYWRNNDSEGRKGMTENLCVQGYLRFWDELLRRNPGLQIDCCAGGGRRNEMEAMRRSVPLHFTDLCYGDIPVKMGFEQTMHEWLPYFRSQLLDWECPDGSYSKEVDPTNTTHSDEYVFYSSIAPAVSITKEYTEPYEAFDTIRKMQPIWREAAELMLRSDFYSLTEYHKDPAGWWCRQFDCPEQKDGFLLFLTGNRCEVTEQVVKPYLDEEATYSFTNRETGAVRTMTGKEAMEGFRENLSARKGSIWFYKEI